ncbi:MAG: ABC transporter ATP-binding protein [Gammaproteobacteria bacterium]|nr:ABC transporter ATP-binding protein [Gammaproteobacteria bacterium]
MDTLLSVRDLEVQFHIHGGVVEAVRGVSFDIRQGATVALVGESGSGKTVTAQAIQGILPEVAHIGAGQILLHNPSKPDKPIDIAKLERNSATMRAIRGGRISMIFQEPMVSLSPLHTIGDQISEALFLHRDVGKREGMALTVEMLRMVGFPHPDRALRTYPFELSGGLRQRAMIAMALVCHPALLIADEPTTALDVTIQAQILELILDLQAELGMAVLIITHDLGVVANIAEEVVVLYHGEVMESGTAQDIFSNPGHPYLQALLRAVPHFDMKDGERLVPVREVQSEVGAFLSQREPWPASATDNGPHLAVRHVNRSFAIRKGGSGGGDARIKAVDNVEFTIRPGECFGLVGESGCGKTTLAKILMRAIRPDSGEVLYNDRGKIVDVLALEGDALLEFRKRMQFIFQDPFGSLTPRMTVFDILREPLIIHEIGDAASQAQMAQDLMRVVGLDPRFLSRYPHSFSGGQRQRIGIARALALQPDLLICDEPVSALDVSIQAQVLNLLKDLQERLGLTYLFISHNLAVVDYVADRIAVMCRGRLVETAPREVLFRNPVHPYTRALLAAVPFPDLDRRLDFEVVVETRSSDPAAWPEPFTVVDEVATEMVDLGDEHSVRAVAGAQRGDISQ